MSGYYGDVFTKKLAEEWLMLARKGEWALEDAGLSTEDFHVMEDEAAEIISKFEGILALDALSELSDAAAESLSKHQGDIYFTSLPPKFLKLSDTAAGHLAKHPNLNIHLDNIPESAAQILRDAGHE